MSKSNENNPQVICVQLGSLSADMSADLPVGVMPKKGKIKSAKIVDQAGVAADNSNYIVMTLKAGTSTLGSLDTRAAGQGALTALTAKDFSLSATDIPAGSVLRLDYQETGTVGLTNACLVLEVYPL